MALCLLKHGWCLLKAFPKWPKMLFKGGVLSSMGWQHHPPRHAAARAALGVQAAHATLGMAPPHMPPSSPRHANAKRARPRHRGEPSHATAVTPCPVHADSHRLEKINNFYKTHFFPKRMKYFTKTIFEIFDSEKAFFFLKFVINGNARIKQTP